MKNLTQLPFLEARRDSASLCFLYNIIHQNMDFESAPIVARSVARFTRHSNSHQLQLPFCRTTQYQNSFFPRTISKWNSLPEGLLANSDTLFFQTSYLFKLLLTFIITYCALLTYYNSLCHSLYCLCIGTCLH